MSNCPVDDCKEIFEINSRVDKGISELNTKIDKGISEFNIKFDNEVKVRRAWMKYWIGYFIIVFLAITSISVTTINNANLVPEVKRNSELMSKTQDKEIHQNKERIIALEVKQEMILDNTLKTLDEIVILSRRVDNIRSNMNQE